MQEKFKQAIIDGISNGNYRFFQHDSNNYLAVVPANHHEIDLFQLVKSDSFMLLTNLQVSRDLLPQAEELFFPKKPIEDHND